MKEYRIFCKNDDIHAYLHIFDPATATSEVVRFTTMSQAVNACKQRGINPLIVEMPR